MPKLEYLQQKKLSPTDELREILNSLEERQVKIREMEADQGAAFLRDLDQAYLLFDRLETAGLDLSPERGRFNGIQARLEKRVGALLRAAGGRESLARLRPEPLPDRARWWWYVDDRVALQKKQAWRRLAVTLVIIVLVIGGIILLFRTVLAPSPEVVARVEAENAAFSAIEAGDYQAALAAVDKGLQTAIADPGLLIFQGVLYQVLGQEDKAEQSFSQAQAGVSDPVMFYLSRAQLELRLNQVELAEADARAVLELDENSARAWLLLAQALETQEERMGAVVAYERAGNLALEKGDNEVYVMARLALARLSGFQ
jgi:tetratricopeptide (TPR) repeat protein